MWLAIRWVVVRQLWPQPPTAHSMQVYMSSSCCFERHIASCLQRFICSLTQNTCRTVGTNCRWCPVKEAPYVLREKEDDLKMAPDSLSKLTVDIMPIGTVREFKVSHDHAVHSPIAAAIMYQQQSETALHWPLWSGDSIQTCISWQCSTAQCQANAEPNTPGQPLLSWQRIAGQWDNIGTFSAHVQVS